MLSVSDATKVVNKKYPDGNIKGVVEYKNLYLFVIHNDDPLEGDMDPFYSVNKDTGEFLPFSIFNDGDIDEVLALFTKGGAK